MPKIGEYAISLFLMSVTAFAAISKISHSAGMTGASRTERLFLKGLGVVVVSVMFTYLVAVTTWNAVKEDRWSNLPGLISAVNGFLWPPIPTPPSPPPYINDGGKRPKETTSEPVGSNIPKPKPVSKRDFFVVIESGSLRSQVSTGNPKSSMMVVNPYRGDPKILIPIDVDLYLRIVNTGEHDRSITRYEVEVSKAHGQWSTLCRINTVERDIFVTWDLSKAVQMDMNQEGLDRKLVRSMLRPNEPVRGFAVFQYSEKIEEPFPRFRMTIFTADTEVPFIVEPRGDPSGPLSLQRPSMHYLPGITDLSNFAEVSRACGTWRP